MTYGQRLEKAMKHAKKTRADLADALKCAPQTIGIVITWAGEKERTLSTKNHEFAARFLKVNSTWLLHNEGEMLGYSEQAAPERAASFGQPQSQAPPVDWPFNQNIVSQSRYEALPVEIRVIVQGALRKAIEDEEDRLAKQGAPYKAASQTR